MIWFTIAEKQKGQTEFSDTGNPRLMIIIELGIMVLNHAGCKVGHRDYANFTIFLL